MRIRIQSDGTSRGTRVVNAETGEELEGIREIDWSWERGDDATVRLSLDATAADITDSLGRPAKIALR